MSYVITRTCADHLRRDCLDVCPVDCIFDADGQLHIAPDECIDCGGCAVACPVSAIVHDSELPRPASVPPRPRG